ncbi:MAG: hypothetical protein M3Q39_01645 [Actinomycetota bacterium]|nr:hypothetical protein [Actinomycetota bacterium]
MTEDERYEAKYTRFALEALNGPMRWRSSGKSWLLGAAVLALVALFLAQL